MPLTNDDTRIPTSVLPLNPPAGNSYYGSHQEFYQGVNPNTAPECNPAIQPACYDLRRDYLTGGFPSGMLRLSECIGLPNEATCGLVASDGFNSCIKKIGEGDPDYNVDQCFRSFTSFAGLRACDRANPCRDDYICIRPFGYTGEFYKKRLRDLLVQRYFYDVNHRAYDIFDYGQKQSDAAWVNRKDPRGVCIPPYFVFQFRSDGHPAPPNHGSTQQTP
jgi:hypothetical protein